MINLDTPVEVNCDYVVIMSPPEKILYMGMYHDVDILLLGTNICYLICEPHTYGVLLLLNVAGIHPKMTVINTQYKLIPHYIPSFCLCNHTKKIKYHYNGISLSFIK